MTGRVLEALALKLARALRRECLGLVPALFASRDVFASGLGPVVVPEHELQIALPVLAAVAERNLVVAIDLVAVEVHHLTAAAGADAVLKRIEAQQDVDRRNRAG